MTLPPPSDQFFHKLARAQTRVLLLDYDGTLAPFSVERDGATPYPGVRQALSNILLTGHTKLVIVSGRMLKGLSELLDLDPLPEMWGTYGWERHTVDEHYQLVPVPQIAREGLEQALQGAEEAGLGSQSEVKPASIALHWRGLTTTEAGSMDRWAVATWGPLMQSHGLVLHDFDGGIELRIPGRDKGTAVRTVLAESPANAVVAYLGDDLTDEDAFLALPSDGLGVLVRPQLRPTAASAWIRPPKGLMSFLNRWRCASGEEGVDE